MHDIVVCARAAESPAVVKMTPKGRPELPDVWYKRAALLVSSFLLKLFNKEAQQRQKHRCTQVNIPPQNIVHQVAPP